MLALFKNTALKRCAAIFLTLTLVCPPSHAQGVQLPAPGTRLALSDTFAPPLLKGIKVYRNDPFRFDFILDKGDAPLTDEQVKVDSTRLIKYFLASLTVPEKDLWVNLSPYEQDRIVPEAFGQTEMGRDLLAQDYILKQITASVIYPEEKIGKEFWDKVYAEALKRYGTTDVPVDTFNKVWIMPETATVYENKDAAFVVESKLKVMLEEDYLALEKNADVKIQTTSGTNKFGSEIIREVVLPILKKEVNEGKNFAPLRQVYNSLILATWYKRKVKDSIMGLAYVDKQKTSGIDIENKNEKEKIWLRYVEAFKKGAFNFVKEEKNAATQEVVPRKYFSGGIRFQQLSIDNAETCKVNIDHSVVINGHYDLASKAVITRFGTSLNIITHQGNAIIREAILQNRRALVRLTLRNNLNKNVPLSTRALTSACVIAQTDLARRISYFDKDGVVQDIRYHRASKLFDGEEHSFLVVSSGDKNYLIDTTFIQFFDEQKGMTVSQRHLALRLAARGYIELNEAVADMYIFVLKGKKIVNQIVFLSKSTELPGLTNDVLNHIMGTLAAQIEVTNINHYITAAIKTSALSVPGGIDFNSSKIDMTIRNSGEEIKFDINSAVFQRLQNALGLTPVIVGIHSLDNLSAFLGVQTPAVK